MARHDDNDRFRDLLKRVDEVTQESERLRQRIERMRGGLTTWPDDGRGSRLFDDPPSRSQNEPEATHAD